MADFEKPPVEGAEKRTRRKSRRRDREAPALGGLAAKNEGLIFARDNEDEPKPQRAAKIAETLNIKPEKDTDEAKPEKPRTSSDESDRATIEVEDISAEEAATLAELTPEEEHYALEEYVNVRGMEIAAEQVDAQPESDQAAALAADATMLEHVREQLATNPDADPDAVIEAAYQEAVNELPPVEETSEPSQENLPPGVQESAEQPAPAATPEAEPEAPQPVFGGQPPVPPRHTVFPNAGPTGPPPAPEFSAAAIENHTINQRTVSLEDALYAERRAETRGLILGGIIGYFIGRRRGRIKTEKRLLPVQEKLEKQVKNLHDHIADKEAQLRQEAVRRRKQQYELADTQAELRKREQVPVVKAELLPKREKAEVAPVVNQAEQKPQFENLPGGQMVELATEVAATTAAMTATAMERTRALNIESNMIDDAAKELAVERVKNLSLPELLSASETVVIGGERLRDIYESKRISEPGLRHVLMEYTRGGNFEKALQQEIHNKELTYERDPHMRKNLANKLANTGSKAADVAGKLATGARPRIAASSERAKSVGRKVVDQAVSTAKKLDNPSNPMQQVVVRTWVVTTIILAIIAFILIVR